MAVKISIIIPCYNQAHYLPDAVSSVLAQGYSNWECIIVNDGSADATEKIALEFAAKDKRIKYIKKENGGLSSARNRGLDEATGEYIQFLDSDDIIDPDKFSISLEIGKGSDVIISSFKCFTESILDSFPPPFTLTIDKFCFKSILLGWDDEFVFPPHCGLFKSALFSHNRFNESLRAREDWLMWLQIYQGNVETVFIDEPFALYRLSKNSMSQNKQLMDASLVKAYQLVYPMVPVDEREVFFNKAISSLGRLLENSLELLLKTRQSKSYRFGNFFVKNFNKIKYPSK